MCRFVYIFRSGIQLNIECHISVFFKALPISDLLTDLTDLSGKLYKSGKLYNCYIRVVLMVRLREFITNDWGSKRLMNVRSRYRQSKM